MNREIREAKPAIVELGRELAQETKSDFVTIGRETGEAFGEQFGETFGASFADSFGPQFGEQFGDSFADAFSQQADHLADKVAVLVENQVGSIVSEVGDSSDAAFERWLDRLFNRIEEFVGSIDDKQESNANLAMWTELKTLISSIQQSNTEMANRLDDLEDNAGRSTMDVLQLLVGLAVIGSAVFAAIALTARLARPRQDDHHRAATAHTAGAGSSQHGAPPMSWGWPPIITYPYSPAAPSQPASTQEKASGA